MATNDENAWTMMLYLSGDNNLSPEMVRAITEVEAAGVPDGFTITIQYDALSPCVPTCRYVLPAEKATRKEEAPPGIPLQYGFVETVKDRETGQPVEDAGDPTTLKEFIEWSTEQFPSKYRLLILSGHGSGAVGDFLTDDNESARRARRFRQPGSLTIRGLARALADAAAATTRNPVIDALGMDSCLMSTLEVAYELRGTVPYLVASEGFVPNAGWPYAHLVHKLRTHVTTSPASLRANDAPRAIAEFIVDDCAEHYDEFLAAGVSFDIAACEVDKTTELADAVKRLATIFEDASIAEVASDIKLAPEVLAKRLYDNVILAHWRAQSFKFEQYTDVWDFASELKKQESLLQEVCQDVIDAVEAAVIRQQTVGVEFQHAHGLSIYFPWSAPAYFDDDYLQQYGGLGFPKHALWFGFLRQYLEKTKREVRDKDRETGRTHQDFPKPPADEVLKPRFRARQPLVTARNKFAAEYNKFAAEYNKYLLERAGGRLPWSMKNPPQHVRVLSHGDRQQMNELAAEDPVAASIARQRQPDK